MAANPFVKWLRKRGGLVHDSVDLFHDFGGGNRGVYAKEDIKEGEQLLLLPLHCTIRSSEPFEDSPRPGVAYLKEEHPDLSPFITTVLLLMAELARGDESGFTAYIGTLPEDCDCLLNWDDESKALLKGTAIEDAEGGDPKQLFEKEVAPILAAKPGIWPAGEAGSYATFKRAAALVQSRAFHLNAENWVTGTVQEGSELFLLPGIDMLNHASDPSRRSTSLLKFDLPMDVNVEGIGQLCFAGFFSMKAERDIKAGEQILHTYGDLSDAQLLQTYGFVDELGSSSSSNPCNLALVPWQLLRSCCIDAVADADAAAGFTEQLLAAKEVFLEECGLLQQAAPGKTEFVVTAANPLPDELLTAVQVMLLTSEEFEELREEHGYEQQQQQQEEQQSKKRKAAAAAASSSRRRPPLNLGTDIMEGEFAEAVLGAVLQAAGLCLERYPGNQQQCEAVAGDSSASSRQRYAAHVAAGEQSLLHALQKKAVQLLVQLGGDEEEEGSGSGSGSDLTDDASDGSGPVPAGDEYQEAPEHSDEVVGFSDEEGEEGPAKKRSRQ